jgi:hypothetical protein
MKKMVSPALTATLRALRGEPDEESRCTAPAVIDSSPACRRSPRTLIPSSARLARWRADTRISSRPQTSSRPPSTLPLPH